MLKQYFVTTFLLLLITFIGAGCEQQEEAPRQNAPTISETQNIVTPDEAAQAPTEPIMKNKMAMPCLQFKHSEGFLGWLEAYRTNSAEQAMQMAETIHLPDEPEAKLVEALRMSQSDGALQTSLCNVHKALGVFTWAVEFPSETVIYTYRNPYSENLSVAMDAKTASGQIFTSTTDLTQVGLPTCLPKTITPSELIWFCGHPAENWKEVHVNRKLGNMKQLSCIVKKDGAIVKPGLGCLDPSAEN